MRIYPVLVTLFLATSLLGQAPTTAGTPPPPPPAPTTVPVTPANPDSIKDLELAYERVKTFSLQITNAGLQAQVQFTQELDKQLGPLKQQQAEQLAIMNAEVKKIKLANKWGDDVNWDVNQGKFVKTVPAQPAQTPQPASPAK